MAVTYIKKIKLSDGTEHLLYDIGAARAEDLGNYLPLSGGCLNGDLQVGDSLVFVADTGSLVGKKITITDIEIEEQVSDYVLVASDRDNGEIKKRDIDNFLEDIGGISCCVTGNSNDGILNLQLGRQSKD